MQLKNLSKLAIDKSRKIEIICRNRPIYYFNNFSLTKSIENFCNSFSFDVSDVYQIKQGGDITIYIDDELVFTGIVESISHNQSSNSNSYTISGRDKTAELIDSYIIPKQYKQNDFLKLYLVAY